MHDNPETDGSHGGMKLSIKDRGNKKRSYSAGLMDIGRPGEFYIADYLKKEYDVVKKQGHLKKKYDYLCIKDNKTYLIEGKTDTKIAKTGNIPWEVFRMEEGGENVYISWGWRTKAKYVIFFSPAQLKLFKVEPEEVQKTIMESWILPKINRKIYVKGTITDSDRLTFIFPVPISLLRRLDRIEEISLAEDEFNSARETGKRQADLFTKKHHKRRT